MKKIVKNLTSIILFMFLFVLSSNADNVKEVPKVSIIVPVYKVEKWLPECMDSLVNQTLEDIEIICVDDGSPDNCGKILDEYAKKDREKFKRERIKVIHQENQGVSAARNAGLDIATGEYITFVDSDDYVDPKTYETAYKLAKKDNVDILQFHINRVCNQLQIESSKKSKKDLSDSKVLNLEQFLKKSFSGYVTFKIIKSDIIKNDNIRFMTDISLAEDTCFSYMVIPRATRFKIIPGRFYNYRIHPESAVKNWNRQDYNNRQMINIINHVYDSWEQGNLIKDREHILLEFVIHVVRGKETNRIEDILKIVKKLDSPEILSKCSQKCRNEIEKLRNKSLYNKRANFKRIIRKVA